MSLLNKVTDMIVVALVVFFLLIALPLLAVIGISLQFGFLLAIPLIGLAVLTIPALRRELSREELHRVRGVAVSWGVTVHPKHSWLRLLGWRTVRIGVDDLAQRFIGPVESVILPEPGRRFEEGEVLATIIRGERSIPLVAPASGVVRRVNEALRKNPKALNDEPYNDGWVVDVKLQSKPTTKLIEVSDIITWINNEIDRLVAMTGGETANGTTMADGGELSNDIGNQLDTATWQHVRSELFANK